MSSNAYNPGGHGCRNKKSGKAPSHTSECDVGLALNMHHSEPTHPNKKTNFIFNPSLYHHPEASIDFSGGLIGAGGHQLFDNSTVTRNQTPTGTSFIGSTGGEMQKMIFTASQLQEFENQTMIYKHIMSSIPIPPQLLLPLSSAQYNNLEPWRCRRTDGKKWRCSRDVMPDQKYCERHVHKNRPRSRKPVETPHSHNTKNLNTKENYHSLLPPASTTQQSRWFSGTLPLSSPSVGSKRDHFFQNLEGNQQNDSCSLTLMQPGGGYYNTCVDQDFFQMGVLGMENTGSSNQLTHHGSWLGGPLGEALCPGVVRSLDQPTNVPSPNDYSYGLQ